MDIPLSMLILICLIFLIIGACLMLLLQYYIYMKLSILPEQSPHQKDINIKYSLPETIQKAARAINTSSPSLTSSSSLPSSASSSSAGVVTTSKGQANTNTITDTTTTATEPVGVETTTASTTATTDDGSLVSINFIMQFLFHELKNSSRVRKWFYRKLSLELDELVTKTTTGKLLDKLTIKELELGDQFPEIKTLRVHNVQLDETEQRIENLDLLLELNYNGNFRTSIDADMVLGKGSLTLKVKQLSGLARLQFTRLPYTHWSLSFLGDPALDLAVESKYMGRQTQTQITNLISNQIRKAVRRKHTLPNYKLRYKPFFHKTPEEDAGDSEIQPNGLLTAKISELSRLKCPAHLTDIYCTLTMASLAFVEAHQKDDRNVIVSLDVEIHKAKNQQIGILFKQSTEHFVEIEAVLPNTPACKSNLRTGDVLIAIEGKPVATIQQVAKVVKSLHSTIFSLRIERVIAGIIRNDAILEDLELYEDLGDLRTSYGGGLKPTPESDLSVKIRHGSAEKGTSSESSLNNTPTSSPKKSKLIAKALKKTISRENSEHSKHDDESTKWKKKSLARHEEKHKYVPPPVRSIGGEGVNDVEHYYQHSTVDCPLAPIIYMEDWCNFKLDGHCKFLNVCVYGKCPGESVLLGFVNIPIGQILAECCETSLTQCLKRYELNPPMPQDLKDHCLFSQSGFNANLCFGDVLFAFTWDGNPNLPQSEQSSSKHMLGLVKSKSQVQYEKADDSGVSQMNSIRSTTSLDSTLSSSSSSLNQPRAHNFIRTHFQRATQCDFCGKKIWLKDAVQCGECFMCCHKKCVNKCQNSTVCGPVDCSNALPTQQTLTIAAAITSGTPEFMVTDASTFEASEGEEALPNASDDETTQTPKTPAGLEVHRSSLTGLLAQGIKRVNSANNLAIPGIVSSLKGASGSGGGGNATAGTGTTSEGVSAFTKSLPPSPQRSPSRKASLIATNTTNPFDLVTQRLESIPTELISMNPEQITAIAEPIMSLPKDEDVMTLAKNASRNLYGDVMGGERVDRINLLLSKLRLALDCETSMHTTLAAAMTVENASSQKRSPSRKSSIIGESEERVQSLSVIMLYLCTGLQHAQGVASQ